MIKYLAYFLSVVSVAAIDINFIDGTNTVVKATNTGVGIIDVQIDIKASASGLTATQTTNAALAVVMAPYTNSGTITATNFAVTVPRWTDCVFQFFWPSGGPTVPALTTPTGSPVRGLGITTAGGETLLGSAQAPHSIALTNDFPTTWTNFYTEPHVHFQPATVPPVGQTNATLRIVYVAANVGGPYILAITNTVTVGMSTVTNRLNYMGEFGHLSYTNFPAGLSAIWRMELTKVASGAQDYTGTIIIDSVDVHVPVSGFGTSIDNAP